MKRFNLCLFLFLVSLMLPLYAQKMNEMIDLERYAKENLLLQSADNNQRRIVFIGNSITESWAEIHPDFFTSNHYICRGISGQTSTQMLLRFRQDIVNIKPVAVLINAGTNDIAENTGKYSMEFTLGNIKSMAELAIINGITPILSSVLPVDRYWWNLDIKDAIAKIDELNLNIRLYAKEKGILYVDYNSKVRDINGGLIKSLGKDGVHPNANGYDIMEQVVKPVLDSILVLSSETRDKDKKTWIMVDR